MTRCPECGRETDRPTPRDNSAGGAALSIPRAAIPMVAHALAIERNLQMMCSSPGGRDLMEDLRLVLDAAMPDCASAFSTSDWASLVRRVADGEELTPRVVEHGPFRFAPSWKVALAPPDDSASPTIRTEITYDNRSDADRLAADLAEEIERLAPMR